MKCFIYAFKEFSIEFSHFVAVITARRHIRTVSLCNCNFFGIQCRNFCN
nr:MAG TPA: hypothetical protein [Caudoviricetes sp.]